MCQKFFANGSKTHYLKVAGISKPPKATLSCFIGPKAPHVYENIGKSISTSISHFSNRRLQRTASCITSEQPSAESRQLINSSIPFCAAVQEAPRFVSCQASLYPRASKSMSLFVPMSILQFTTLFFPHRRPLENSICVGTHLGAEYRIAR